MTSLQLVDLRCECGEVAIKRCSEVLPESITLTRCQKPICGKGHEGSWCRDPRHEDGPMGYPGNQRISADYEREDTEGEGVAAWAVARWRNAFWSSERKANHVWQHFKAQELVPPIPLPSEFKLRVNGFLFELRGDQMVKVER